MVVNCQSVTGICGGCCSCCCIMCFFAAAGVLGQLATSLDFVKGRIEASLEIDCTLSALDDSSVDESKCSDAKKCVPDYEDDWHKNIKSGSGFGDPYYCKRSGTGGQATPQVICPCSRQAITIDLKPSPGDAEKLEFPDDCAWVMLVDNDTEVNYSSPDVSLSIIQYGERKCFYMPANSGLESFLLLDFNKTESLDAHEQIIEIFGSIRGACIGAGVLSLLLTCCCCGCGIYFLMKEEQQASYEQPGGQVVGNPGYAQPYGQEPAGQVYGQPGQAQVVQGTVVEAS